MLVLLFTLNNSYQDWFQHFSFTVFICEHQKYSGLQQFKDKYEIVHNAQYFLIMWVIYYHKPYFHRNMLQCMSYIAP